MKNYLIRKVKREDAEQTIRLINLVWNSAYKTILPKEYFDILNNEENISKKVKLFAKYQIEDENAICYVVESGKNIIGVMTGQFKSNNLPYAQQNIADLQSLYIHPNFQHKGIGKELFDIFVKEIRRKNIKKFVIGVFKDNIQARKVYEKWGGQLDDYTKPFVFQGVDYKEIFYIFLT